MSSSARALPARRASMGAALVAHASRMPAHALSCSPPPHSLSLSAHPPTTAVRSPLPSCCRPLSFEGVSLTELHGAASSFAAWDLDHDGVLSKEEALTVLASLAEEADGGGSGGGAPEAQTLERLFALMDADGNGVVDFNEWLAVRKQI